ncbi:MAG: hypothetical protein WD335_01960 [Candidatus Paceibacterota bacterium]
MTSFEKQNQLIPVEKILLVPAVILVAWLMIGFFLILVQLLTGVEESLISTLLNVSIENPVVVSFSLLTASFPFLMIGFWKCKERPRTAIINLIVVSFLVPAALFTLPSVGANYLPGLIFNLYAISGWIISMWIGNNLQK